ncbi:MAG: hypothetical protein ACR2P1_29220 [Pseudomonadales bacterium]
MSILRPRSNNIFASVVTAPSLTAAALVALLGGLSPFAAAEPLQLKTADQEVYGSREIDSGKYHAGIEKLEIALARTNMRIKKAPILIDLCVAYVATSNLVAAKTYCDQAVENGYNLDLAYNNRGVMHLAAGNVEQGVRDFELAVIINRGHGIAKRNLATLSN